MRGLSSMLLVLVACQVEEHPAWQGAGTDSGSGTSMTAGTGTTSSSATGSSTGGGPGTTTDPTATDSTTGLTATGGGTTGTGGGSTGGDVGPTACVQAWIDGTMQIGAPEILGVLNSGEFEGDPYLSSDGLTLYFASDRLDPGSSDIYMSTRATLDDPWGMPALFDELNTADTELTFAPALGDTLALFTTDRPGGPGQSDVWQVSRANAGDPWGTPEPVLELSTPEPDWDVWLSPDGLTVYLNHGANDANNRFAERASVNDPFPTPGDVSFNTSQTDSSPTLSGDLRVFIYGSYKPGGMGGQDLYYAARAEPIDAFPASQPVPMINSAGNDGEVHLRADGCELYYTQGQGLSTWDIYRSTVTPP